MQKKKLYYGWIVTLLAGLTYFGSNGLLSASAGTIVSQVLLVKGWDAAQVSFTYTLKSVLRYIQQFSSAEVLSEKHTEHRRGGRIFRRTLCHAHPCRH